MLLTSKVAPPVARFDGARSFAGARPVGERRAGHQNKREDDPDKDEALSFYVGKAGHNGDGGA